MSSSDLIQNIFHQLNRSLAEASLEDDSGRNSARQGHKMISPQDSGSSSRQMELVPQQTSLEEDGRTSSREIQLVPFNPENSRRAEGRLKTMRVFGNDFYELNFYQGKEQADFLDPKR